MSEPEAAEPASRPVPVIGEVSTGAAQVPDRLLHGGAQPDRDELPRLMQSSEFLAVPPVRLDRVAGRPAGSAGER